MAVTTATTHEPAAKSASAATRDGARALSEHSADAQDTASEARYSTLQTMSRMIYTCSYALAYGVVYATVFIAQSLPQENPVMNGFRDGRQAAWTNSAQVDRSAERQSRPRRRAAFGDRREPPPNTLFLAGLVRVTVSTMPSRHPVQSQHDA